MKLQPTSLSIGGKDLTGYISSIELFGFADPRLKEVWRDFTKDLPVATIELTWEPEPSRVEVSGTYLVCPVCAALPVAPLPEGWCLSLHRAPNPAGAHLKTEEPIFITVHCDGCPLATSIREESK